MNSANVGPYGDAIETELIPAIEKQFRGIGQGWARFTYGGSTGGWEALAVQSFIPTTTTAPSSPAPTRLTSAPTPLIDLYNDKNAYYRDGAHRRMMQPAMRNYLGQILITAEEANQYERALGTHGRSGEQYDIWQAVYLTGGRRWLSQTHLQQRNRRDRSRGRRLLERALRSAQLFWSATGRRSVRSCKASSTSIAAAPTAIS